MISLIIWSNIDGKLEKYEWYLFEDKMWNDQIGRELFYEEESSPYIICFNRR